MTSRWQKLIQCPFNTGEDGVSRIHCEGLTKGGSIQLFFRRKEDFVDHMAGYCCNRYAHCPIYKTIIREKYPDEE